MKRLFQWRIKIGIRAYNWIRSHNWPYPVIKVTRWRINLAIKLHSWLFPDEKPISLLQ
ncbi:MAG: hypothetical protein MK371_07585 [SAR86 cluster bacterium]|nr:hypothetical protein [SAR86 cluster bacterium]